MFVARNVLCKQNEVCSRLKDQFIFFFEKWERMSVSVLCNECRGPEKIHMLDQCLSGPAPAVYSDIRQDIYSSSPGRCFT